MKSTMYDATFYKGQKDASLSAGYRLLPLVFSCVPCNSLLDVGCGVGSWVAAASALGVSDALGMDGSYVDKRLLLIPEAQFLPGDVSQSIDLKRRFDLVISMEVAEHLPSSAADTFVENLTRHADVVLFSAAIPGQGGTNHINEQWPEYWQTRFRDRGYEQFDVLRGRVWNDNEIPCCYRQNAYLYVNAAGIARYPALQNANAESLRPIAKVHPDVFTESLHRPLGLRRLVNELPDALWTSAKNRGKRLFAK